MVSYKNIWMQLIHGALHPVVRHIDKGGVTWNLYSKQHTRIILVVVLNKKCSTVRLKLPYVRPSACSCVLGPRPPLGFITFWVLTLQRKSKVNSNILAFCCFLANINTFKVAVRKNSRGFSESGMWSRQH